MNSELPALLHRWREGSLTPGEMRTLTALLAKPKARAALRREWFLDAALPQALAASAVIVHTPQPSFAAMLRASFAGWLTHLAPQDTQEEGSALGALRLWARASYAALAAGLLITGWLVWPQGDEIATNSEPAYFAQLMLQNQLADSP